MAGLMDDIGDWQWMVLILLWIGKRLNALLIIIIDCFSFQWILRKMVGEDFPTLSRKKLQGILEWDVELFLTFSIYV